MRSAIILDCGVGPLLSTVESLIGRSRSAVENLAALRNASQLSDLTDASLIIIGHRDAN